ncbi:serine acetyltransferase [Streptomyces bambusae]|uniref:serine O-acetyltransferase EpsC n=1 Tax=Streptomyces bambusae TaxID=1550616 RepID=UPI001CFD300C|nr:serine O-acetyltransferase EpsC [Streptomyces bambusae]MCB5165691.1 serine acetyltransferase [Streptomyces bambusae]
MAGGTGLAAALREDLETAFARDPSLRSRREALGHPGLRAVWAHRVAHRLHLRGLRGVALRIARRSRRRTGVEIHPGAVLGRRVFIDHGAAVVIGETAVVGADVTIYHQVTLGAVGWWVDCARPLDLRRHPVVGDQVVLGAGASVLGPVTVGARALVGAGATVVHDVPADARVYAPPPVVLPPRTAAGPAARAAAPTTDRIRLHASSGSW